MNNLLDHLVTTWQRWWHEYSTIREKSSVMLQLSRIEVAYQLVSHAALLACRQDVAFQLLVAQQQGQGELEGVAIDQLAEKAASEFIGNPPQLVRHHLFPQEVDGIFKRVYLEEYEKEKARA